MYILISDLIQSIASSSHTTTLMTLTKNFGCFLSQQNPISYLPIQSIVSSKLLKRYTNSSKIMEYYDFHLDRANTSSYYPEFNNKKI